MAATPDSSRKKRRGPRRVSEADGLDEVEILGEPAHRPVGGTGNSPQGDHDRGRSRESREGLRETTMHGQNPLPEQPPHLAPALTALILGVVVLEAFGFYARSLESRMVTALAANEA